MGPKVEVQSPIPAGQDKKRPRRSIKAEGTCLNGMLREGCAKVIDASKLGKRLSSEIWNSFGAIQVEDDFSYPSIDTKVVSDGNSTMKICQFFVACSRCFSVFKYDGHAYGTTGLVKHVKICQGNAQRASNSELLNTSSNASTNLGLGPTHTSSIPNDNNTIIINPNTTTATTTINGPITTRRRREPSISKNRNTSTAALRYLTKIVEETRCDLAEVKQKVNELVNLMSGPSYQVSQIQIISNDGDKVESELQKTD